MKLDKKKLMELANIKSKKRLMELAGVIKELATDREAIARFIWGRDQFMDNSEQEIERIIDELEEEWLAVKDNYSDVMDYLDELEDTGGLEGFMNEGKRSLKEAKSNIKTTWRNVQDLEADMQDWMSTLDAQQVQDVLDTLQNFVDNYEGGMDMDDDF